MSSGARVASPPKTGGLSGGGHSSEGARLPWANARRMNRKVAALMLAVAAVGLAQPVGASVGGIASDNIEHVKLVPFDAGTAQSARVVGKYMYVTSYRAISIYDISDPLDPQLLSTTPVGYKEQNEDVATDGKILLFSEFSPQNALHIWNVEDKSNPVALSRLEGAGDHTMSCILSCAWAYGSDGSIVDLRDPAQPKLVGNWHKSVGIEHGNHDVEEFKKGFVLTASYKEPFHLLDVRIPSKPKVLAMGPPSTAPWWWHGGRWPNQGRDNFVVMGGEGPDGPLVTFDATRWKKTRSFTKVSEFVVPRSTPCSGICLRESSHWFDEHPRFANAGLLAVAWYIDGTRLVRVSSSGRMKEIGYFVPYGGITLASYWMDDRIIYSIDHNRGIDILRYTGDL